MTSSESAFTASGSEWGTGGTPEMLHVEIEDDGTGRIWRDLRPDQSRAFRHWDCKIDHDAGVMRALGSNEREEWFSVPGITFRDERTGESFVSI